MKKSTNMLTSMYVSTWSKYWSQIATSIFSVASILKHMISYTQMHISIWHLLCQNTEMYTLSVIYPFWLLICRHFDNLLSRVIARSLSKRCTCFCDTSHVRNNRTTSDRYTISIEHESTYYKTILTYLSWRRYLGENSAWLITWIRCLLQ